MPAECLVPPLGIVAPAASELLVGDCMVYAVTVAPVPAHMQARDPSRPFVAHLKPFAARSRRPGRIHAPVVGAASYSLTRHNKLYDLKSAWLKSSYQRQVRQGTWRGHGGDMPRTGVRGRMDGGYR